MSIFYFFELCGILLVIFLRLDQMINGDDQVHAYLTMFCWFSTSLPLIPYVIFGWNSLELALYMLEK